MSFVQPLSKASSMSLTGKPPSKRDVRVTSANRFRTLFCAAANDAKGQEETHAPQQAGSLFDYVVGEARRSLIQKGRIAAVLPIICFIRPRA